MYPFFSAATIGQEATTRKKKDAGWLLTYTPLSAPSKLAKYVFPFVHPKYLNGNVLFISKLNRIARKIWGGRLGLSRTSGRTQIWYGSDVGGRRVPLFFGSGAPFLAWPPPGAGSPSESPTGSDVRRTGTPFFASPPSHHHTPVGKGPPPGPPFALLASFSPEQKRNHHSKKLNEREWQRQQQQQREVEEGPHSTKQFDCVSEHRE